MKEPKNTHSSTALVQPPDADGRQPAGLDNLSAAALLQATYPLRFVPAELLLPPDPTSRRRIRTVARFVLPNIGVVHENCETSCSPDVAEHLVVFALAEPIGWSMPPDVLRRRAVEALQVLIGGDPATVDGLSDLRKAQIERVVRLAGKGGTE